MNDNFIKDITHLTDGNPDILNLVFEILEMGVDLNEETEKQILDINKPEYLKKILENEIKNKKEAPFYPWGEVQISEGERKEYKNLLNKAEVKPLEYAKGLLHIEDLEENSKGDFLYRSLVILKCDNFNNRVVIDKKTSAKVDLLDLTYAIKGEKWREYIESLTETTIENPFEDFGVFEEGEIFCKYVYPKNQEPKKIPLTDFKIEVLELIQGEEEEEVTLKITNKDHRKPPTIRTTGIEVFNSKQKLNAIIGFNTFFGDDKDLTKIKAYLLDKFQSNLKIGVDRITYKDGVYIGNKSCINFRGEKVEGYKLLESKQEIQGTIETEEPITPEELKIIKEALFSFNHPMKSRLILGWFGATFLKPLMGYKFPYLFIVGGAGAGKTSTIELFQNLTGSKEKNTSNAGGVTLFSISKNGASSNMIPFWIDEFKLHKLQEKQQNLLSEVLRMVYNQTPITRGRADQTTISYKFTAPLMLTGETRTEETAVQDRSIFIELDKREKQEGFQILEKNQQILKKLGKTLLLQALAQNPKNISKRYDELTNNLKKVVIDDRERNNIAIVLLGLEFIEKVTGMTQDHTLLTQWYGNNLTENHKNEKEKFIEVFQEMIEAHRIYPGEKYKIIDNNLRIIWSAFYNDLVKASKDGVISYEILNNRDLKKLLKAQEGINDSINTKFEEKQKKCLSITLTLDQKEILENSY